MKNQVQSKLCFCASLYAFISVGFEIFSLTHYSWFPVIFARFWLGTSSELLFPVMCLKIYQNITEIEAWHLKIYNIQKTSGNLKKTSSRLWGVMWRHVMWTFRTIFVGNFTMHLYHSMDRCTLQENLDSRISSIHYFHCKFLNLSN